MFKKCLILAISVFLLASAFTMYSPKTNQNYQDGNCPNSPVKLKQGDIAVVTVANSDTLNLRVQPGTKEKVITKIAPYTYVTVVSNPICNQGIRWFEIGFTFNNVAYDGWAAEVGSDGDYNMIPNGQQIPTQNPSNQSQSNSNQNSDVWPDSLIGTWKGSLTCVVNNGPRKSCEEKLEVVRQIDGKLIVSQDGNNLTTEQETYREIQETDGSTNYFYCFNQLQTQNGETVIWGELCLRVVDDYDLEVKESDLGGGEWGTLTRVDEPTLSQQPQGSGQEESGGTNINPLSDSNCGSSDNNGQWWNPFNPPSADAAEQCTQFVQRTDAAVKKCWSSDFPRAGLWDDWAKDSKISGKCGWSVEPLNSIAIQNAKPGDIVVWNGSDQNGGVVCSGADPAGHVAIYEDKNDDGTIRIDDRNSSYNKNRVHTDPSCMSIIHVPSVNTPSTTTAQPNQQTSIDKCSQFGGLRWLWCKVFGS